MAIDDGKVLIELQAKLDDEITPKLEEIADGVENIGDEAGKATKPATDLPKKVGEESGKAVKKVHSLKKSISELGKVSKFALAGIGASAAVAIKKYTELESGIRKVQTISNKSFEDLKKGAQKLATTYGISTQQILEGNYQLVSSMGDVAESQEILNATAKLSIAGFTEYSDAMNGLVAVLNGYKMEATEVAKVSDILMTVQNKGITTVGELQAGLGKVIPTAALVGVKFEDLAAAIGTITSNKISTAETITYLNQALSELGKNGNKANEEFKKIAGTDFISFMNQGHTLMEALGLLEKQAKRTGLTILDMFSSTEAAKAVANLTGENTAKFADTLQAVNEAAGTTDKAFKTLNQSAGRAFAQLKEQANVSAQEIGKALVPQVEKLTEYLKNVDWEKIFSEKNIDTIINTGKEIAGVAAAIWGIEKAIKGVEVVMAASAGLKTLLALAGGGSAAVGAAAVGTVAALGYGAVKVANEAMAPAKRKVHEEIDGKSLIEKNKYLKEQISESKKEITKLKRRIDRTGTIHGSGARNVRRLENERQRLKALEEAYKSIRAELKITTPLMEKAKEMITEAKETSKEVIPKIAEISTPETKINPQVAAIQNEIAEFYATQPKIWEALGLDKQAILKEKIGFLEAEIKKAISQGATSLVPQLKKELNTAKNTLTLEITNIKLANLKENLEKELASIKGDGVFNLGKQGIAKVDAEYSALTKFVTQIEAAGIKLEPVFAEEINQRIEQLKKEKKIFIDKEKAERDHINSINQSINAINTISGAFSSIGASTGNSTMSGIGSMLGNVASLGSAVSNFGGMSSITGMFSGEAGALSGGLSSIGAAAAGAAAVVGIGMTAMSMMNAKGKKKAARIDRKNKENEEKYKQQVAAMEKLTQALRENSKLIKNVSDRLVEDIAKNPTLRKIAGGERNYSSIYENMMNGKHFNDISAIERGSSSYRKYFRKKRKSTYTAVTLSEAPLLKYLGFDKTELDHFNSDELHQLKEVLKTTTHSDLVRATGRNLTQSNIEEWKKQVWEFTAQMEFLEKKKGTLLEESTLYSFTGIDYRAEKELIEQYTEDFKKLGLVGEQYSETIKELAKNNQIYVTSIHEVRQNTISGLLNGTGGFTTAMKGYFEEIRKNAASIVYDVMFDGVDSYFTEAFKGITNKLVEIKKSGKISFKGLFDDVDFNQLKIAADIEKEAKASLDVLKQELLNSGVDLSLIERLLPESDFTDRINKLKETLANAMDKGLTENSFVSFTKGLGEGLYSTTKASLVKAFSESSLYQGLIQKFIKAEDFQSKIEKAGSFKEAFGYINDVMGQFGKELEAAGYGGFDAISKIEREKQLGNAYYTDKQRTIEVTINNTYNGDIYGLDDFENKNRKMWNDCMDEWQQRPQLI